MHPAIAQHVGTQVISAVVAGHCYWAATENLTHFSCFAILARRVHDPHVAEWYRHAD